VTAPRKLTEKQVKLVSDALAKHAGRAVKIDANVDESLLGGLVVRLGSTMIDTSLKSKLEHLQLAMKEVG
jgi:F-type H+-transporting ATPase subunit delta